MYPLLILTIFILLAKSSQTSNPNGSPNEVTFVDFRPIENSRQHHTFKYAPYVFRRGEKLNIFIYLRQAFSTDDRIRLELNFGTNLSYIPLETNSSSHDTSKWFALLNHVDGRRLNAQLNIPATVAVGIWRLKVTTKLAGGRRLITYSAREALYIIFNPWSLEDDVHLPHEEARQEYVLNEIGKIYAGTERRQCGSRWTYGQFHPAVLPTVISLLDTTGIDEKGRGDVVRVSRAISALVNSHDDNGLLVGNWSGNYDHRQAPSRWTGSPPIFEQYQQSGGRPVKFGQCWVFGGVTTTALRTLGIPARTVSNFLSAHDTDFSLTVDQFSNSRGNRLNGVNGDSIWNFHVWSDAWMERYDLPQGYGGWQALDATPQETSMGRYQLGPASVEAIKQGKVNYAYDVGFVYSEVNADVVDWTLDERSPLQWRKGRIRSNHVGRSILTKMIGVLDDRDCGRRDAEDISHEYKHFENSKKERSAYFEAAKWAGLTPLLN